ncbi:DUF397 domain-containing protein [Kitasatospora sp. NPDC008050]|uniref:DUF397 domain-containing protein n=1 Tax=Kitasatospora sp. NPDC008050 TaxID=3364021 RepID=UPI0036DFC5FC
MSAASTAKADLYSRDLSGVAWMVAPGSYPEDRLEAAFFEDGAVALRCSADPMGTVLFYTATEWHAFVCGLADGEFDEDMPVAVR